MDPDVVRKFWERVDVRSGSECWEWKLSRKKRGGYGQWSVCHGGPKLVASRIAWEIANGPPGDLHVLHSCDNPPCCNPSHLFLGTNRDNVDDKVRKGRQSHAGGMTCGEDHPGHKLTAEQVVEIRTVRMFDSHYAKKFGVNFRTVWQARTGARWGHLSPQPGQETASRRAQGRSSRARP